MPDGWVYTHMEYNRITGATKHPVTLLKAKCLADALEEGKGLWHERLKGSEDAEGAKRLEGCDGLFWPSKPRVKLDVPIPVEPFEAIYSADPYEAK
ncbi:MAG: hypothetical protein Q7S81_01665 [bacterium]|nr:hypothetical protein [bacterium]